jgi:hypothetical protein
MRSSVAKAILPVPVQSTDDQGTLPLKTLVKGPDEVQSLDGDWILSLISDAINIAYPAKRTAAAYTMKLDPSHMNRLLDADGHLSVRKLGLLSAEFWLALAEVLRAKFKIDSDAERLRRALDARAACDRVIEEIARKGAVR